MGQVLKEEAETKEQKRLSNFVTTWQISKVKIHS
jgi:hypothetical protein